MYSQFCELFRLHSVHAATSTRYKVSCVAPMEHCSWIGAAVSTAVEAHCAPHKRKEWHTAERTSYFQQKQEVKKLKQAETTESWLTRLN